MLIRCCGPTLSDVILPAIAPQPSVMDGKTFVVIPVDPCGAGGFTKIRIAGPKVASRRSRGRGAAQFAGACETPARDPSCLPPPIVGVAPARSAAVSTSAGTLPGGRAKAGLPLE